MATGFGRDKPAGGSGRGGAAPLLAPPVLRPARPRRPRRHPAGAFPFVLGSIASTLRIKSTEYCGTLGEQIVAAESGTADLVNEVHLPQRQPAFDRVAVAAWALPKGVAALLGR